MVRIGEQFLAGKPRVGEPQHSSAPGQRQQQPSSPWNVNADESHCRSKARTDWPWPSSSWEPSHDQTSRPSATEQTGQSPAPILVSISATESK